MMLLCGGKANRIYMGEYRDPSDYDDFDYIGKRKKRDLTRFVTDDESDENDQRSRDIENQIIFSKKKRYEGNELLEHYSQMERRSAADSARRAVIGRSTHDREAYTYRKRDNGPVFGHRGPAPRVQPQKKHTKNIKKKTKESGVWDKVIKTAICIVVAIGVIFAVYYGTVASLLENINISEVETSWEDDPHEDVASVKIRDDGSATNILLLGIDSDGSSGSRADTIIILSITGDSLKLTSILRDNLVYVPGHGRTKINHSYAYGGAALTMRTIESNYRIKIDEYISIDMDSLVKVVEAVGGVTLEISDAEAKEINNFLGCSISGGRRKLTAEQAVYFSRIRRIDSDFARTGRQRKLLSALVDECKSLGVSGLMNLAQDVSPYLTTNMSRTRLATIGLKAVGCLSEPFEQLTLPFDGSFSYRSVSGMSVLDSDLYENTQKLHEFIYG